MATAIRITQLEEEIIRWKKRAEDQDRRLKDLEMDKIDLKEKLSAQKKTIEDLQAQSVTLIRILDRVMKRVDGDYGYLSNYTSTPRV